MENKAKIFAVLIGASLFCACYKEDPAANNAVINSLSAFPQTIPADGFSKSTIQIRLPDETPDANNSIAISTTKGLFDIIGKNAATISAQSVQDSNGWHKVASIALVSGQEEGVAVISATVKNYTIYDTVIFSHSYPDQIRVLVDKLNYPAGSGTESIVTVQLKKNPGTGLPSTNQTISLDAVDSTGKSTKGSFRNKYLLTDASGSVVNYFSLPLHDTSYLGKIKFIASVPKDETGNLITDSTFINIYK